MSYSGGASGGGDDSQAGLGGGTQYAVKSNIIVVVTVADIALNCLCDYSDDKDKPQWFPAVVLG
jgi:hypothetical protein